MGIFNDIAESTGGGGGGTGTGLRGLTGVSVDNIQLIDNNDGSIALNFSMSNGSTIGPISASLVSDSLIALNKISLEGTNDTDKLLIKDFDNNIVFNVNSLDNVVTITEINNEDVNKLKLDNMDGFTEANKFVLTNSNNSFYVGGLTGSYIGPSGIEVNGEDGLSIRGEISLNKFIVRNGADFPVLNINTSDNTTTIFNIDNVDVNKLKIFQDGFADPNKAIITNNFNTFQLKNDINDAYSSSFGPEGVSIGGSDGLELYGTNSPSKFVVADVDGNPFFNVNTSTGETTITLLRNEVYSNSASTGVVSGGILSIGTPNTTFSISDGYGYIVDTEVSSPITWTGKTNITVANLATQLVTYILIGTGGIVYQQSTYPTAQQQREKIFLGVVVHVSQSIVDACDNRQVFSKNPISQLYDVLSAIGFLNVDGNIVSAFSNTLQIRKSLGKILASGANYNINPSDPHVLETPLLNPATFQYRMRNGFNYTGLTQGTIITTLYDVGTNVPGTVPNNAWSIQRFYLFPSNAVKVMFSQFTYASKADALSVVSSESFIVEPSILANGLFIGYLIVKKDTIDLSNIALAQFYSITKFGATSSAGAASSNLQASYNLSESNPEILTNSTQGGVNIRRGSTLDTDIVLSIQNGAGTTVSSISGEGVLTANKVIFKEYHHLPSWDMSDFDKDDVSQYFLRKCQPNANFKTILESSPLPTQGSIKTGYHPYLNRIYLAPTSHSDQSLWWYFNCKNETFTSYTHNAHRTGTSGGMQVNAYFTTCYHAHLNRLYFIPYTIDATQTNWHYISSTGTVVAYTSPPVAESVTTAYQSGVYSPKEKRIYMIPRINQTYYHYIDDVGAVIRYIPTIRPPGTEAAHYDPTNNRIWLAPQGSSNLATWYYINCDPPVAAEVKITGYLHGQTGVPSGLTKAMVFHPILNRIYFVPNQGVAVNYYIDCNTATIGSYIYSITGIGFQYGFSFFLPTMGAIIFAPRDVGTVTDNWDVIDYQGNTKILTDTTTFSGIIGCGFYDPYNDMAYMLPGVGGQVMRVDPLCCERIDRFIMASSLMGN